MSERATRSGQDSGRTRIDDGIVMTAIVALVGLACAMTAPMMLMDGDTGWHLATGRWILAHAAVPTTDPFSYTAHGQPWIAHEWLSEVAMFLAWRAGGWSGLIALTAVAFAALLAIVGLHLRRWTGGRGTAVGLLLLALAMTPTLIARPHLLALPLLAAWISMLLRAREADRAPLPGWAALMLVWANMHGSFVFGLLVAAVLALDALVDAAPDRRLPVATRWGAFGLLSLGAALATPGGLHGLLYPFYVGRLVLLPYISEWRPSDFARVSPFEIVLLAGLFILLVRPTRVAPVRLLLLLGSLHLALQHMRQISVFVVLAVLVLAEPIGRAWNERTSPQPWRPTRGDRRLAGVALMLAIDIVAVRIAVPVTRADSGNVPATALRHLPAGFRDRPVFNEYSFGGSLILEGVAPFIDGRSDMYGDAFSIDYFEAARGDRRRWRAADRRWRFGWTMLPPTNPLVPMLDTDPHWHRSYADDTAVIHVRR